MYKSKHDSMAPQICIKINTCVNIHIHLYKYISSIHLSASSNVLHVALVTCNSFDEGVSSVVLQVLYSFGCHGGGFPMPKMEPKRYKQNKMEPKGSQRATKLIKKAIFGKGREKHVRT